MVRDDLLAHMDGSPAVVETPYIRVVLQHGAPHEVGVNGCRVEDVIGVVVEVLIDFQGRAMACEENERALYHLGQAKEALEQRRRLREQQGVIGTMEPHRSE